MTINLVPRYYQIKQAIKKWIVNSEVSMGEKIPSENELVNMLGVSRISVREALKQLISLGLLEARQGEGTFVKQLEPDSYMNELLPFIVLNREEVIELIKYREIIEVGAVALAVERADEADIHALEENVRKHEQFKDTWEEAAHVDLEFHLLIAKASKNILEFFAFNVIVSCF